MRTRVTILGTQIDDISLPHLRHRIREWMVGPTQHYLVTPNPEMLVAAVAVRSLRQILNRADLALADGIGLIWASRFLGTPIHQRHPGVEVLEHVVQLAAEVERSVFFLGGRPGTAQAAAENFARRYPRLRVAGATDGGVMGEPFRLPPPLYRAVQLAQPAVLVVALGHGKQERFIATHLSSFPTVRLAIGVGGALDYWSGRLQRAPSWCRQAGLEWLYRLVRQPWRLPRLLRATVIFPLLVITRRLSHGHRAD